MAQTGKRTRKDGPDAPAREPVCPVSFCPVGMFLTVTGNARPEAVEHLMAAGREFLLALTAILNTRVEDLDRRPSIEKIELE